MKIFFVTNGHERITEHEPLVAEGDDRFKPGMIISDEPIYVPGFGGFRHSDTLLIRRRLSPPDEICRELEACIIPIK